MRIVSNKISYFTWKVKEKIFESDLVILESDTCLCISNSKNDIIKNDWSLTV